MGRTAVIAGTATAVSNRVSRRQAGRWNEEAQAQQQAQEAAPTVPAQASTPPSADRLEQLKQLGELKASGVLTDAEFEAEKARILAG
jgi:hypothetical protein